MAEPITHRRRRFTAPRMKCRLTNRDAAPTPSHSSASSASADSVVTGTAEAGEEPLEAHASSSGAGHTTMSSPTCSTRVGAPWPFVDTSGLDRDDRGRCRIAVRGRVVVLDGEVVGLEAAPHDADSRATPVMRVGTSWGSVVGSCDALVPSRGSGLVTITPANGRLAARIIADTIASSSRAREPGRHAHDGRHRRAPTREFELRTVGDDEHDREVGVGRGVVQRPMQLVDRRVVLRRAMQTSRTVHAGPRVVAETVGRTTQSRARTAPRHPRAVERSGWQRRHQSDSPRRSPHPSPVHLPVAVRVGEGSARRSGSRAGSRPHSNPTPSHVVLGVTRVRVRRWPRRCLVDDGPGRRAGPSRARPRTRRRARRAPRAGREAQRRAVTVPPRSWRARGLEGPRFRPRR